SSAIYSAEATTLEQAQQLKLHTICQRLQLSRSDHLLEIGSGWGGLAIYAANHFGCKVTTTTISDAQYDYAAQTIKNHGLEDKITLLKQDYRDLTGKYDKLVSIEMIEAVGHQYFDTFFRQCDSLLKDGGKMLIQAITIADQRYTSYIRNVDFIRHFIFPGGCLPSISVLSHQISKNSQMVIEQLDDIGLHYAKTVADWRSRFDHNWPQLQLLGYDDRFRRLWHYYLCYCEGAFLQRATSAVQLVARKL
ncbi:MAG: cyclopropane-fatty-acyl-phospholipid synthase, partial [Alteromonadaceae bacterium]